MLSTEKCPNCGIQFTVVPDELSTDDSGTQFCSFECCQAGGLFIFDKATQDIFSKMFNDAALSEV